MNKLSHKFTVLIFSAILVAIPASALLAGIAISGNSVNSLSISSSRSESNYHYLIEIYIEGIETSKVIFETDYQTLYLSAGTAGDISDDAITGAQVISLSFSFPADANLKNYFRVNQPNKILISIPKS